MWAPPKAALRTRCVHRSAKRVERSAAGIGASKPIEASPCLVELAGPDEHLDPEALETQG